MAVDGSDSPSGSLKLDVVKKRPNANPAIGSSD